MSSNYSIFPQDTALGPSQGHHKNFRQHNCLALEQQDAHKKCSEGSRRARQTRPGHIPDERRQSSRATSVGMGGASLHRYTKTVPESPRRWDEEAGFFHLPM